jgi:hypothetical protein
MTMTTRNYFLLVVLTIFLASSSSVVNAQSSRNSVTVTYEYQLEVNNGTDGDGFQDVVTSSTQDTLSFMDRTILSSLQNMLPNNGMTASSPGNLPNVQFFDIQSEIFSACFTSSDQCSLVRSSILVTYEGDKPKHAVERVSYRLIREYLEEFNNEQVLITYMYPMIVSNLAQFQLSSVDTTTMGDVEIDVMEKSFIEVFGATVAAMEGDTEITDVRFIFQDIKLNDGGDDRLLLRRQLSPTNTLSADLYTHGYCRLCTENEYASIVNSEINSNLGAFVSKLKSNGEAKGSNYFDNVTDIAFDVPELPPGLPAIDDASLYDSAPPQTSSILPWFFFFGITVAILVVVCGIYVICKDLRDLDDEKDELSTSSESDSGYSGGDDQETQSGMGVEEYDVRETNIDKQISMEEYQVETILSKDDIGYNRNTRGSSPKKTRNSKKSFKRKVYGDDSYGY